MGDKDIVSKEILKNIAWDIARHILHIEILSTNRNLEDNVRKGEEMLTVDIEKMPSFNIGFDRGIQKGIQEGI